MSNYTNKHIAFNKEEYVGHLEPPIEEIPQSSANPDASKMHSITTERMMAEKVYPDTFKPSDHKLEENIKTKLMELLMNMTLFAQHETTIGPIPLTEMTIDTRTSEPVSQKPYQITLNTTNGSKMK